MQIFQSMLSVKFNEVHQMDNISRILWYSGWLHNTTPAGNSIMQPTTVEYEK